jgi:hypothetical protein
MSAPFGKFRVVASERWAKFNVSVYPITTDNSEKVDEERRKFIEDAIREKLDRERKRS